MGLKYIIALLVLAALCVGLAVAVEKAVATIDGWVKDARAHAIAERDAYWSAEIAKSNLEVAQAQARQADRVAAAEDQANDKIAEIERDQVARKKDSDALPETAGNDCGLSAARVGLLPD